MSPENAFHDGQIVFERFGLSRKLGEGGMGEVWLANDVLLEKRVALKFLPGGLIRDQDAYFLFKQEAQKSTLATHPHIVRVFDFHRSKDLAAISMEFVEGCTLASLAQDRPDGIFDPHELQKWLGQLCEALAYAHQKVGLVHRDLKPSNLMVDRNGDLKVTDFGISGLARPLSGLKDHDGGVSGTLPYMSPQQLAGAPCQPSDDIYSLGATLYELLTGRPPFTEGNLVELIRHTVPPSIQQRRQQLHIERYPIAMHWEAVIARCLAKDPVDRPPDAKDIAIRLLNQIPQPVPQKSPAAEEIPTREPAAAAEGSGGRGLGRIGMVVLACIVLAFAAHWGFDRGSKPRTTDTSQTRAVAPGADSAPPAPSTPVALSSPSPAPSLPPIAVAPKPEGILLDCHASWAAPCGHGLLLLLEPAAKELCLWNETAGTALQRVPLSGSPCCQVYQPNTQKVLLAYSDGRITQVPLANGLLGAESAFARAPTGPMEIAAAGYYLVVVIPMGSSWTEHHLFDSSGRRTDVRKNVFGAHHFAWSQKHQRLFFLTEGISPVDIHYEDIGSSSRFTKTGDSPYHDSTGMTWPVSLLGRTDSVLLGSGRIFDPLKLELEMSLPTTVRFVLEQGDTVYCVAGGTNPWGADEPKGTQVLRLGADFTTKASFNGQGKPIALGLGHDGPYVASVLNAKVLVRRFDRSLSLLSMESAP